MVLRTAAPEPATPKAPPDGGEELMAIARQAAAGDHAATQRFIQAVWPAMTRVITGVLGSSHAEIEDVVQQSLIGLLRSLPAFRGECHPVGYASRIALHIALRARRRAGVLRLRTQAMAQLTVEEPFAPSAGDTVAGERRRQVLRDLLHDLPEEQADALALRLVLGWSLEEVAAATGAPVNTVRSRVRLGKEALRRRIEASPELLEDLEVER
jgi:RNA polymerase sigma-70 factor (ECF subfamily)